MSNLYICKMTAEQMRAFKLHYQFIVTTCTEWKERQCSRNEPIEDVYPNVRAPFVVLQNGEQLVREEVLRNLPKYKPGANWGPKLPQTERCLPFFFAGIWVRGPATAARRTHARARAAADAGKERGKGA